MLDPRDGDYFPWLDMQVNAGLVESDGKTSNSFPSVIDDVSERYFNAANPQEGSDESDVFSDGSGMYDTDDDDSFLGPDPEDFHVLEGPL